jgi:UDP-hydrolysing UDP-N-acetyl-D-glucosamine 2-epimerase
MRQAAGCRPDGKPSKSDLSSAQTGDIDPASKNGRVTGASMPELKKRRKVCVVITARPSYSRVRSVLLALRERQDVELQIVVAASALLERFGNVAKIIEQDGFTINGRAFTIVEGETLVTSAKSMGLGVVELVSIFDALGPDVVVTVADRYETLATAVAASYINVPVAHLQGGEVTGSIDEKVRHAVTKLSNLHFASTKLAANWIIRLGERPDSVFCTGCPSIDIAAGILHDGNAASFNPFNHYGGVGPVFDLDDGFIIVMQHPVTTEFNDTAAQIVETLEAVVKLDVNAFWFWPNIDAGSDLVSKMIRTYREEGRMKRVHFFRNLLPEDFLKLMQRGRCIVGNSSVSIREGSFLGVPAVNIGTRQQFRERGINVIDVGYDAAKIGTAIEVQYQKGRYPSDTLYGDGRAGGRIAQHLASEVLHYDKVLTYAYDQ